jgi:spore coat polysaccharide biosynthesis protein SpsF
MNKTVAVIQARMGSTRLPGKVVKPILGQPLLARMLERVKRAAKIDAIIVATSVKTEDNEVANLAVAAGVSVFRGAEKDVLDRFYQAAKLAGAKAVVRLTGDCPLQDPAVIDEVVARFQSRGCDYTSMPRNYPEGLDVEIFSFKALERAAAEARLPSEREHVSPYIKNHPEFFKLDEAWTSGTKDEASLHWSVDTAADFEFVTKIFEHLYPSNPNFSKEDVLVLLADHSDWLEINKGGTGYEGLTKSLQEDEEFKKQQS